MPKLASLLPYRRLVWFTPLNANEISASLQEITDPRRWFRWSSTDKLFEGEITEESFHIQRIIRGRNSFLPQIYGYLTPCNGGTRVTVTMRIHWFTGAFMTFWVGFLTFSGLKTFLGRFEGSSTYPEGILPFGMVILGFALTLWGFLPEVEKAKRLLLAQIHAISVNPNWRDSERS